MDEDVVIEYTVIATIDGEVIYKRSESNSDSASMCLSDAESAVVEKLNQMDENRED